ncbi:MAG: peptide deformylase [Candidatus Cloacimonadaceae bacterium]|jgi:peptide deformylase|nr:peptide deformylase [Candidatus Cloacimonadota bacterium]MDY0127855.1 peptide deformylase [Candidatus Cloacimonadaceae bacterium]MCB5255311.1 peptide deformylase [Candidatus Cloacimonadota bacterium]MCK9178360.1 peptide deformylase [Candidatus Cloacimonadota bacterium]MCK9242135.1 peptide deformylase [Candidatus Cloacimonadota bacterium]
MAKILPIRIYGDEILRKKLKEADLKDPFLKQYLPDLIHTMYERDGVGLASSQVGVDLRIFVMDPWWAREEEQKNPRVLINPEIHDRQGEQIGEEGCLSVPDIFANVNRALKISYSYYTPEGEHIQAEAEGYEAVVIQHEYDHLNGVLFTDRVSTLAKLKFKMKLKSMAALARDGVNIMQYPEDPQ